MRSVAGAKNWPKKHLVDTRPTPDSSSHTAVRIEPGSKGNLVPAAVRADRLTLTTASGAVIEFEREPAPTLECRTWNVTLYNNGRQAVVSPIPDTRLTLSFENGAVSGEAGCNAFRATYTVQGNRVTIGLPATTRKACADALMAQERAFRTALESVA